jgi:outer membrane autotransporter protein
MMINRFSVTGLRVQLLLGVSLIAVGTIPVTPSQAADACTMITSDKNIDSSFGCVRWMGGSLSITSTGTLSVNDSSQVASLYVIGTTVTTMQNSGLINSTLGGIAAISNSSSIGTISNSGIIKSSSSRGIFNSSSAKISLVENTGPDAIISGKTGIHNDGSIGLISNAGTITGSDYAIYNQSFQKLNLQNSGVISGNIEDSMTSSDATISGSSDASKYGILTGYGDMTGSGNIGTINHNFSNLNFTSGYLLLNDHINVKALSGSVLHTVVNSGATLKLVQGISITGNYTQTDGGLVVQAASASSFGSLTVSGDAAISNTTLVMSGNNLAIGDTYTIVGAGGTATYAITNASVVGTQGRGATTATVGKDLVVTITEDRSGGGYQVIGAPKGRVGSSFGATLDEINFGTSTKARSFQNKVLAAINSLPSSEQGSAIKKLAPTSAANNVQVLNQATAIVHTAIQGRQLQAMSGGSDATTGIAAGGDVKYSTFWGQVLGGSAHMEGNSDQDGFSSKSFGLTTGFDHLVTPDLLAGAAVSWLRSWTDGSNASSGSSNKIDSYQVTLYGSWRQDRLSVDGQLGAGWNHFDQKRQIDFLGSTASADYDGQQYSASSRVGYDFSVGDSTTLTPFAGLRWIHARNDSYDETGAGLANNSVDNLNTDSVTHEIGAKATWQFDTALGAVTPEVSAAWIHDYTSSAIDTTGRIGGTAFSVQSERLPSDGARIGIAVAIDAFASGKLRVTYDGELRAGYQSQTATVRVAWDF